MSTPIERPRLYFLDNLRWIMIARVVLFHTGAAYCGMAEYFHETQAGGFMSVLRDIVGTLPGMSVLFFVAGYFALPSLIRRGAASFVWGKLYRLGIPFLLCVFFLGPLMPYMGYYSQSFAGLATDSYWSFWGGMLADGFLFELSDSVFTTNTQFHPMHFWFLSELLEFLLILVVVRAAWRRWVNPSALSMSEGSHELSEERVSGKTLLVAALVMAGAQIPVHAFDLPGGVFLGIFQLQPQSLISHGVYFGLGVYACTNGWFTRLRPPGWASFGVLLGALVCLGAVGFTLFATGGGEDIPRWVGGILGSFWMTISGLWFLVVVVGLTHRYMNKPSAICARLAQASYPTYLLHYPLILVARLFLLTIDLPAPVKGLIVYVLVAASSVFLGLYLLRARPRLAVAGLLALHVILLSVGFPRTSWSHLLLDRLPELHKIVPDQRPATVVERADEAVMSPLDGMSRATPAVGVSWTEGRLYVAAHPKGLLAIDPDGQTLELNEELELSVLTPRSDGLWAIDRTTNTIVAIDSEGQIAEASVIDSSQYPGQPWHLASRPAGGLYFSAGEGDSSGVYYISDIGDTPIQVALLPNARGLSLSPDGGTLYAVADADFNVWAFDAATTGELSNRRAVAELFRGDGRYGRQDLQRSYNAAPEGMLADATGRLFVSTFHGLQVFSAAGRLLGIVDFPDVPLEWDRIRPLTVSRGADASTLYVSIGEEVYSLQTRGG
ncbi:MAG: acyltransferase family protein [Gemmatimonadetes bacterium]|nr:acyltransferase family protein [Gemmatimonadota bacterium]MBT7859871.1 acyltransferase family protein [Gemmatimonadota bacterium]